jgi:CRP-like cAMP-binding protein
MPENQLLSTLPAADLDVLRAHLSGAAFPAQSILYEAGDTLRRAYFPCSAAVSLVIVLSGGQTVEAALIGRDGMLDGFCALDGQSATTGAIVQVEGAGWAIEMDQLRQIARQREAVQSMLLRHERALLLQIQQMAACNAAHTLEGRLCRWLLRAHDACGKQTISTTQESIAEMLSVKRTSVSLIAHAMQQAGLIRNRRGHIELLNMDGLRANACECYAHAAIHHRAIPRRGPRTVVAQIA